MNVLIVAQKFDGYSIQRLVSVLEKRGHSVRMATPFNIAIQVGRSPSVIIQDCDISTIDIVLLRTSGFTSYTKNVARVLEFHIGVQFDNLGIICVNNPIAKQKAQDKFYTLQVLNYAGIPVPESFLFWDPEQFDQIVTNYLSTPLIMKLREGTWGVGVMKADSLESAHSVFDAVRSMGQVVSVQQYINYKPGCDIRAFVVNGKVIAAMERVAQSNEFRSNLHAGGKIMPVDLRDEYVEIATAAAKALGLDIAGVDIIESSSGPKVLEVNPTPGLEGIEKTTGISVSDVIVSYLEKLVAH